MSTSDRDPVTELRQRLQQARNGLGVNTEALWLPLTALDGELSNVVDGPSDDPDAVAVARALLGGEVHTEWSTARDDQDVSWARLPRLYSRAAAKAALRINLDHRIVRRAVTHGPWQDEETEGGAPDA